MIDAGTVWLSEGTLGGSNVYVHCPEAVHEPWSNVVVVALLLLFLGYVARRSGTER